MKLILLIALAIALVSAEYRSEYETDGINIRFLGGECTTTGGDDAPCPVFRMEAVRDGELSGRYVDIGYGGFQELDANGDIVQVNGNDKEITQLPADYVAETESLSDNNGKADYVTFNASLAGCDTTIVPDCDLCNIFIENWIVKDGTWTEDDDGGSTISMDTGNIKNSVDVIDWPFDSDANFLNIIFNLRGNLRDPDVSFDEDNGVLKVVSSDGTKTVTMQFVTKATSGGTVVDVEFDFVKDLDNGRAYVNVIIPAPAGLSPNEIYYDPVTAFKDTETAAAGTSAPLAAATVVLAALATLVMN